LTEIILRKETKKHPAITATYGFHSVIYYDDHPISFIPFPTYLYRKVMLLAGATKCIDFNFDDKDKAIVDMPVWSGADERKLFEAEVLRTAGVSDEMKIPTLFYILIGAVVLIGLVNFLVSTGRLLI
jgi:hypothetical protein